MKKTSRILPFKNNFSDEERKKCKTIDDLKKQVYREKSSYKTLRVRKNYWKVTSALYRALYTDEPLTNDELKLIIEYVMEEYK